MLIMYHILAYHKSDDTSVMSQKSFKETILVLREVVTHMTKTVVNPTTAQESDKCTVKLQQSLPVITDNEITGEMAED